MVSRGVALSPFPGKSIHGTSSLLFPNHCIAQAGTAQIGTSPKSETIGVWGAAGKPRFVGPDTLQQCPTKLGTALGCSAKSTCHVSALRRSHVVVHDESHPLMLCVKPVM